MDAISILKHVLGVQNPVRFCYNFFYTRASLSCYCHCNFLCQNKPSGHSSFHTSMRSRCSSQSCTRSQTHCIPEIHFLASQYFLTKSNKKDVFDNKYLEQVRYLDPGVISAPSRARARAEGLTICRELAFNWDPKPTENIRQRLIKPRPISIFYRFSSLLRDSSLWSKKCKTDPGAGRQARADEGRRRRENMVQPDSSSPRSQAGLYRRRERATYVPPSLQLVCSNFTPFALFERLL